MVKDKPPSNVDWSIVGQGVRLIVGAKLADRPQQQSYTDRIAHVRTEKEEPYCGYHIPEVALVDAVWLQEFGFSLCEACLDAPSVLLTRSEVDA